MRRALASAVIAIRSPMAQAQEPTSPSAVFRQSLDDAWWTGPMLAPSAIQLEAQPWSASRCARDPGWTQYGLHHHTRTGGQFRSLTMSGKLGTDARAASRRITQHSPRNRHCRAILILWKRSVHVSKMPLTEAVYTDGKMLPPPCRPFHFGRVGACARACVGANLCLLVMNCRLPLPLLGARSVSAWPQAMDLSPQDLDHRGSIPRANSNGSDIPAYWDAS
jgi:hypothetical protein